jgi:hypothetical protein
MLQRIAAALDEELLICFQRTADGEFACCLLAAEASPTLATGAVGPTHSHEPRSTWTLMA